MTINDQELRYPIKQQYQPMMDERAQNGYTRLLGLWTKDILPNPDEVHTVIDLFCGRGVYTAAELGLFSHAQIHAVDYHESALAPVLKKNKRLVYHVGLVTTLLHEGSLPQADFITIGSAGANHGFKAENITDLVKITRGFLLTAGDNDHLESAPWFMNAFAPVKTLDNEDGVIWKPR